MLTLKVAHETRNVPELADLTDSGVVQIWRDRDGSVSAYGQTSGGEYQMYLPKVGSFSFGSHSHEVTAIGENAVPPGWIVDAYHRVIVPLTLQVRGIQVLHASAVLAPHGVIALCATKETGKSTLAFALGQRGYSVWADDAVAFTATSESVQALSLPFHLRLRPASAAFFGQDRGTGDSWTQRMRAEPLGLDPEPLAAVCVLTRSEDIPAGTAVDIQRLNGAAAFTAVLAHGYCFGLPGSGSNFQMVQQYLDLVAQIPIFQVRFGTGLEKLGAILDGIELVTSAAPTPNTWT